MEWPAGEYRRRSETGASPSQQPQSNPPPPPPSQTAGNPPPSASSSTSSFRQLPSISHMMFSPAEGSSSSQQGSGGPPYPSPSSMSSFPTATLPPLPDNRPQNHMAPPPTHGSGGDPYLFRPHFSSGYPPYNDYPPTSNAPYNLPPGGSSSYRYDGAGMSGSPAPPQSGFSGGYDNPGDMRGPPMGGEMGSRQPNFPPSDARRSFSTPSNGADLHHSPSLSGDGRLRRMSGDHEGSASKRSRMAGPMDRDMGYGGSRHPGLEDSPHRRGSMEGMGLAAGMSDTPLSNLIAESMDKPGVRTLKRTYQACIRCRKKKLKCDSALPRCTPCASSGSECQQADVRRQTSYPRGYVEDLESRCQMFQQILQRMLPQVPPAEYPSLLSNGTLTPVSLPHWQPSGSQSQAQSQTNSSSRLPSEVESPADMSAKLLDD